MIGTLLQINGQTVPNIKSYKVGNNKLWADADRNMDGDVRATFIGVFPKIPFSRYMRTVGLSIV